MWGNFWRFNNCSVNTIQKKVEYEEICLHLIDSGADVLVKNHQNNTALFEAILKGYSGVAESLIKNGADVNQISSGGSYALHQACLVAVKYQDASFLSLIRDILQYPLFLIA